ncbi:MAG: GxxExxY protein [Planctomycetota bacterium]
MKTSVGDGMVVGVPEELNQLTRQIIGAAIEVHRVLGPGLLESVYEEALCVELTLRSIPFARQRPVDLVYKGHPVGKGRVDLLVQNAVVVELNAVDMLLEVHAAQLASYLRTTGYRLGLLINFNMALLKDGIRRIINTI